MTVIALAAHRLQALSGWRRRLALMALGALGALALPPVGWVPVLFVTMPPLVWAVDSSRDRRAAFGAGWWWSMGWFSAGLYWISYALLTDPVKFGWMIPFAVFGLSGLLAAFVGLATGAVKAVGWTGPGRIVLLAVAWVAAEWVRSWIFTGFPWNPIGSVWDGVPAVLQFGAVAGIWGLGLLTALAALAPALLAEPLSGRGRLAVLAVVIGLPLVGWAGGSARLAGLPDPADPAAQVPGIKLRLVQASVSQALKWQEDRRETNLHDHVALSRSPGFETITTVVWPETAVSYFLDLDGPHRAVVSAAVPPGGVVLTGMPRVTPRGTEPFRVWNSLVAVTSEAEIAGIYDKAHLVPFGEYMPLRSVLPIAKITHGGTDFTPGPGPTVMHVAGLPPFSPMICYEAIFPGATVPPGEARPDWLLNVTNDGWFGMSAGPYQHLAAARMRAVEEGLPLFRAANTGISAVIDPYGREVARLDLGARGIVDSGLPRAGLPTPYGRWGNAIPLILGGMMVIIAFGARRPLT